MSPISTVAHYDLVGGFRRFGGKRYIHLQDQLAREELGSMLLRNAGIHQKYYTRPQPRRTQSELSPA